MAQQQVYNRVQLIGLLGADPELKTLDSGKTYARISLAVKTQRKTAGGELEPETHWYNLGLWEDLAHKAQKELQKGSKIAIDGRLSNRSYTDKDGNKKTILEIIVNNYTKIEKAIA